MAKRPPARVVHLIETQGYFAPVAGRADEFTSGYWAIPLHVAKALHGATAYYLPVDDLGPDVPQARRAA